MGFWGEFKSFAVRGQRHRSRGLITLRQAVGRSPAVTINYGSFIQSVINFLTIALAIFVVVRMLNRLKRREAEAPSLPPAPSREEVLLTEIRDELRARNDSSGS